MSFNILQESFWSSIDLLSGLLLSFAEFENGLEHSRWSQSHQNYKRPDPKALRNSLLMVYIIKRYTKILAFIFQNQWYEKNLFILIWFIITFIFCWKSQVTFIWSSMILLVPTLSQLLVSFLNLLLVLVRFLASKVFRNLEMQYWFRRVGLQKELLIEVSLILSPQHVFVLNFSFLKRYT